jgi:hypothetical protein
MFFVLFFKYHSFSVFLVCFKNVILHDVWCRWRGGDGDGDGDGGGGGVGEKLRDREPE